MSDVVIKVENLGKRYRIRHGQREPYMALRDVLARRVVEFASSLLGMGRHLFGLNGTENSNHLTPNTLTSDLRRPTSEDFWALKDVSFEVKRGEVVGIIGRNGAGKSTLLKILSRITEPTEGRVRIKGRVASLLEVGTGFHPELSGRENIFLNGAILGMTKEEIKTKFDDIVAFAEIEKFLDTPVKRYSSGMYVRLAFAVAAHLEPEILLVDEVLAVGDSAFQKKCLGKMKSVAGEGRTVLFVSHNMAAIESLCDTCLLLNQGKKNSEGSSEEIIRRYMGLSNASCSGSVEFDARTGERFGPKELAVLQSLQMSDPDGNPLRVVRMGEPLVVQLMIEFKEAGAGFEIGVAIVNTHGVYLHYFVSPWEGFHQVDSPGLKTVEVSVPALYLFPGTYFLSVWVKRQGGSYDDAVHEALGFDVEEASITPYTTYFARYSHNSQVYAPSRWRFVN
jgi:lipopolysaccharide transport system ATP-binding protein